MQIALWVAQHFFQKLYYFCMW